MGSTSPIWISSKLVNEARTSAELNDRSLIDQIEHWEKLGRAVESVLSGSSIVHVKEVGRVPDMESLVALSQSASGQRKARAIIQQHALPVYESDPESPNLIMERLPDSTTRRGRFANRKFIPEDGD